MFYDEEDRFLNPDLLHAVHREIYAINSNLDIGPFGRNSAPTHTEDGIPIRKLYVSNLPPKTTRTELFGVFAQYGFIKSCWLRMGDKGPNKTPTPTYAFVTFSNPADAHKALEAPAHEKLLRGRHLRISPADSWHQPTEDANGHVRWKPVGHRQEVNIATSVPEEELAAEARVPECEIKNEAIAIGESSNEEDKSSKEGEPSYTILDVLNTDCWTHILDYLTIRDLVRSERVSKTWQSMVRDYIQTVRTFKTSQWQNVPLVLTTAVLRRVLQRVGPSLLRLHIDHRCSALNDRTAHTVGKFCPGLEELMIIGMHTKNWNPLIYGCKLLKHLTFISCNKLTDASLVQLLKNESCLESLTIENNTHVTGLFLTGSNPQKLNSLSFYNCYSLQATVLSAALDNMPGLTTLKLDVCPATMWKIIPLILNKLPKLQELSLSEITTIEMSFSQQASDAFCDAFSNLPELRVLNLSKNIFMNDAVLIRVGQYCPDLKELNVSSCNSRRTFPNPDLADAPGIGDEGLSAVSRGCRQLAQLDVSYLAGLSDAGVRALAQLPRLARLVAQGNRAITAAPLVACLSACTSLAEVDVCGCDSVSDEVVVGAVRALEQHPRHVALWLASTPAAVDARESQQELPSHKLLKVDLHDDRSNPHLRPDFVHTMYDDSSEDSLDELYDHDIDDFFGPDDDFLDDDEMAAYEGIIQFGIHAPNVLLL